MKEKLPEKVRDALDWHGQLGSIKITDSVLEAIADSVVNAVEESFEAAARICEIEAAVRREDARRYASDPDAVACMDIIADSNADTCIKVACELRAAKVAAIKKYREAQK